jgi:hypothetical protein
METKRDWIHAIIDGKKDVPVAQHWMSFFNEALAQSLTPPDCHYSPMWMYDGPETYDFSGLPTDQLDWMIRFNEQTGRCFYCLGRGENLAFCQGGPGEFVARLVKRDDKELIAEYETGVQAKVQFNPHFYHHDRHPVKTLEDLERLELPDPADPRRYREFAENVVYLKSKGEYVLGSLNGFFSGIHYFLMDYPDTLRVMLMEPELIQGLVDRLGEWNMVAANKMAEAGVDAVALCDDLGSKQNLLMSPDLYRTYFKPWHKRLCWEVHEHGARVHLHSHGAIEPILDDLAQCGFDFINPFDPEEGWDVEAVLQKYSDQFVVVGGFPTTFWNWEPPAPGCLP